jgi:cell division protein ZapA
MPQVSVTIAGRAYRMACDNGQEEHLIELGRLLDTRIDELRAAFGEIGDMRLSVMAAITMADELAEARRRLASLEQDVARLSLERNSSSAREEETQARLAQLVADAADRMERLADTLGRGIG